MFTDSYLKMLVQINLKLDKVVGQKLALFLCQLTDKSADIMTSLRHLCTPTREHISSKSTRPRDMLLLLKDTLSIEDDKS